MLALVMRDAMFMGWIVSSGLVAGKHDDDHHL